jgi:hypothetical protein
MLILTEVGKSYDIDSFTAPLNVSHFWTFSGHMLDFKLEEIKFLEEIVGQTVRLKVGNSEFDIPASWHIMIVDKETYTIDMIPITQCASFDQDVLLFAPNDSKLKTAKVNIIDYKPAAMCIAPEIPKGSAMILPVLKDEMHGKTHLYSIIVGGHDLYRWISSKTVGDILG